MKQVFYNAKGTFQLWLLYRYPKWNCIFTTIADNHKFTNLAKANWEEAVALFYSPEFCMIIPKNDKNALW